ncbi:MAG: hypothetical protein JW934_24455 [Anaerolineae bacterium]|nr:hypothetical protein [Anaerolineae bacterium]
MCGIFGVVAKKEALSEGSLRRATNDLFRLSESRGKESAGLAVLLTDEIRVLKESVAASTMIRSPEYRSLLDRAINGRADPAAWPTVALMGHSRLVTNGSQENHDNNQPVVKDGLVAIHNGIIVNDHRLWQEFPALKQTYQIDTEVILSLYRHFYTQSGDLAQAAQQTFAYLAGTASVAVMAEDLDVLILATNNGSLYTATSNAQDVRVFASEAYILRRLVARPYLRGLFAGPSVQQIRSGMGCVWNVLTLAEQSFSLDVPAAVQVKGVVAQVPRRVVDVTPEARRTAQGTLFDMPTFVPRSTAQQFAIDVEPIRALRRCTRCVLPETMPFIEFDEQGVCNYCRHYAPIEIQGREALLELADHHRRTDGRPDCLVTFSGGRDSSFCLHYVKTELDLHPVAYTYDWGMVTDLARRNQARLCGKLGIEHILVSADIAQKRTNIRKNVLAWLRRPDLGTVPLFMAGDKQYFYYANQLKKQTGIQITILGENLLETTKFKSGFCGVRPSFGADHTYTLPLLDKARLAWYHGRQYLTNPAYLNSSLWDTLGAFVSYYIIPHDNVNLYDYVMWNEQEIVSTLRHEYDWEVAADTQTTWRIGDGTAAFYNYIYYCVAGFNENDTFRSNQIREGMLTREAALATLDEETRPRFESIQWYCNTIGIDFESTMRTIRAIPKLYPA